MSEYVYEDESGVMLHVEYDPEHPISFKTVRALDPEYKPVGPNLIPLLDNAYTIIDGTGMYFLTRVFQEIMNGKRETDGG